MTVRIHHIQEYTAMHFGVTVRDMKGESLEDNIIYPRHIGCYLARLLTDATQLRIAKEFGRKDPTTVQNAVERIGQRMIKDAQCKIDVETLAEKITAPLVDRDESDLKRVAEYLAKSLREEAAKHEPNVEQLCQLTASKTAITTMPIIANPPMTKAKVATTLLHPEGSFCKAAAAVSIAAAKLEQARHTSGENLALQDLEKASIAFAKEFHAIKPFIKRKTS